MNMENDAKETGSEQGQTSSVAKNVRDRIKSLMTNDEAIDTEASIARGIQLREQLPLECHASWEAPENRPDPVDLLRSQGKSRVQALLPLRYERMSASPFTFYRGAALIMASDLSNTPTTGIKAQICGDAHISNFGLFLSPERRTVFDINDFDETLPGPWEWDLKRLVASVEICGRDNDFSKKERKAAVRACAAAYREAMQEFATMGNLDVWYAHMDIDSLLQFINTEADSATAKVANKTVEKSKGKNSARAVRKLTEMVDGKPRIISDPPLVVPMRDIEAELQKSSSGGKLVTLLGNTDVEALMSSILIQYRRTLPSERRKLVSSYTAVDMAHKVVGVGSVGTLAFIIMLRGANEDDHLILQVKEAQASVLERFLGTDTRFNHGKRVVEGQRAMQTVSDSLLGWCTMPESKGVSFKDYYVRQLWDGKGSIDLSQLSPTMLTRVAEACGWTLAHAHARTGNRFAIASYLGETDEFDRAMVKFARSYADQNEADYARFMQALEMGELSVQQ